MTSPSSLTPVWSAYSPPPPPEVVRVTSPLLLVLSAVYAASDFVGIAAAYLLDANAWLAYRSMSLFALFVQRSFLRPLSRAGAYSRVCPVEEHRCGIARLVARHVPEYRDRATRRGRDRKTRLWRSNDFLRDFVIPSQSPHWPIEVSSGTVATEARAVQRSDDTLGHRPIRSRRVFQVHASNNTGQPGEGTRRGDWDKGKTGRERADQREGMRASEFGATRNLWLPVPSTSRQSRDRAITAVCCP